MKRGNRNMVSKVSENLYLVGPASQVEEMRIEVAKETPYEKDLLDMVKHPTEFLEDRTEVNPTTFVSAGHFIFLLVGFI